MLARLLDLLAYSIEVGFDLPLRKRFTVILVAPWCGCEPRLTNKIEN
jgi:hypothetical protein